MERTTLPWPVLAIAASTTLAACSSPAPPPPGTGGDTGGGGGQLAFDGFSPAALRDFAVVPEEGADTFPAREGDNSPADGFFWRHGQPGWWFKIPNHCAVTVRPDPNRNNPGTHPSSFTWSEHRNPAGTLAQQLRNAPARSGWQPDHGTTGHPAVNPF